MRVRVCLCFGVLIFLSATAPACVSLYPLSIHFCSFVSICASFCQCKAKYLIAIIGCAQEDASKTPNQELADTFDVELAVALKSSQMTVIPAQAPVRHVARKCVCRTILSSSQSTPCASSYLSQFFFSGATHDALLHCQQHQPQIKPQI